MPETTKLHPKQPVAAALASRAAVRPALRQGGAFALGLAGGWAVLYGTLLPFGLGLTLGLPADCFAACAAGAALSILFHGFGAFSLDSLCLLCAVGAAVAARWLWPGRLRPAFLAGCGALVLGGACFALGPGGAGFTLVFFCGADALLAGGFGYALQRFPPEKPGFGTLLAASAVAAALGGLRFGPLCLGVAVCAMVDAALCCRGQEKPALAFSAFTGAALCAADPSLAPVAVGLCCGTAAAVLLAPGRRAETLAACAGGAALSILFHGFGAFSLDSLCLLCAVGAAVAARWLWPGRLRPAFLAGCGALVLGGACFALGPGGAGFTLVFFCGADALLAGGFGYALQRFPPEKPGFGTLLAASAVAAALGGLRFGPLCLGAAACAMVDAALCCRGQEKPALAFAAFTGAALCAADPSLAPAAVGLCCGTAAAVLLVPGRRAETLAACAGGCVLGVLCVPAPGTALPLLLSAGLGLAAPAFFPKHWLTPVPEAPAPPEEPPRLSAAATRLEAVAESLSSLAETVNAVYDAFPRRCDTFRWVIDNTHDSLCFNCGRRETCWKQEYTATLEGMNALRSILEQQGHLQTSDLPGQLSRCIHPAALCAAANRSFALYRSRKEAHVHAEAMRTALTEQYSAMADALSVLSEQLGRPGNPEPYKSGRVAAFFASLGTPPLECAVTLDDLGRARAAVTLPRTRFSSPELAALAQETGRICRRDFDPPQVLSCKGMTTLLFCEKPALRAVFGTAGTAAKGTVSGDAVQQFCSPAAAQMILCDGMGTGRPAAVDGSLAAELTARLLKAGFTAELAARLVNVALALKSDEESGATLDLISVDLYTGTARIFKAGAAPGFLVHGGRARPVGDISLPIGILGGVNGQSRVVHLAAGDYAVLVSDGLLVDGPGWVAKQLELSAAAGDPPEKVAQILVETARARAEQTGRPDDITAAVLRLEPCGH